MRILIFSDTHFTTRFEPARCNYMMDLLKKVDQVVINGDFFESYVVSFEEFLESEWQQLFPLLKEKRAIYLYGNHDLPSEISQEADKFSLRRMESLKINLGVKEMIVMHGHQVAAEFDGTFPAITEKFKHHYPAIFSLLRSKSITGRLFRFIKSFHNLYIMRRLQQFAHRYMKPGQILLTGHSHLQVDDRENGFINLGFFESGIAHYAIIDSQSGKIEIIKENYEELAEV